jgi:hypothetical protein
MQPWPGSVTKYGSFPTGGKGSCPMSSTGTLFSNRERSSSTACGTRERLATHRIASFSYSRRYASTRRLPGSRKVSVPRPNAL